jgi:hypothetical protein
LDADLVAEEAPVGTQATFEGRSVLKLAQTIWKPGGEKQCEQPNAYVYDVMVAAATEVRTEAKK